MSGPPSVRWALFHTNRVAWEAAKAMLQEAQQSIAIEQFIFSSHGIGREILDILTSRAKQGVRVRVLADWFGSRNLAQSEGARALLAAGGELAVFNPPSVFYRSPADAFHRLHRKSILCDDSRLMTGGSCFHPRMEGWRDTMVLIEGPVARDATIEFETTWLHVTEGKIHPRERRFASPPNDPEWSYLVSSPFEHSKQEYDFALFEGIAHAERIITLTSPYLVPVGRFWHLMKQATRRGVRVRVMIPARSDQPMIDIFSFRAARRLLGRGVEVYGYAGGMMHAKLAAIDGKWSAVGSFNLGVDSFRMNLEGALVSKSADFCASLMDQLDADLAMSRRL
jgi:cardiolipin synthase A/B